MNQNGELLISAPIRMKKDKIYQCITDKKVWIERQLAKQQQSLIKNNNHFWLWGKPYKVTLDANTTPILINKDKNNQQAYPLSWDRDKCEQFTLNCYRLELLQLIPNYINYYSPIIGVTINEFRLRKMRTRWGSCNSQKKRIWFNPQLAKYPKKCCEYVVVHEMTHLLERHHNNHFYKLVQKAMPDWQHWHQFLRKSAW